MLFFLFGLAAGVLLTIPLAAVAASRWARRVQRLEQRARSAERLAELGTLTGGLAHEIKNPLSTIGLNLQLMQEDLNDLARSVTPSSDATVGRPKAIELEGQSELEFLVGEPSDLDPVSPHAEVEQRVGRIARRFESLSREAQRLRHILEDFLRFAGRVRLDLRPTNINDLVNELADFFQPQAQAAGVHLRTQFDATDANVKADSDLLKQALLNLMINACKAMAKARESNQPSGGSDELIVRTQRTRGLQAARELRIHVIDTGPGMDRETTQRIFHPYYSASEGGTGLGLPTARRIIEEHGGVINCHSEPGRGTDFVIGLPINGDRGCDSDTRNA